MKCAPWIIAINISQTAGMLRSLPVHPACSSCPMHVASAMQAVFFFDQTKRTELRAFALPGPADRGTVRSVPRWFHCCCDMVLVWRSLILQSEGPTRHIGLTFISDPRYFFQWQWASYIYIFFV